MPGIVQVVIPAVSGKPEDAFVNTFAFDDDFQVPATLTAIYADLDEFYFTDTGEAGSLWTSVANMLSDAVVMSQWDVKFFDIAGHLDGSPHGSPVRAEKFGPIPNRVRAGAISGNLPDEAALVLSFHGNVTGAVENGAFEQIPTPIRAQRYGAPETHLGRTKPRARRRGRIYIGPLIADVGGMDVPGQYHVMASARNVLTIAANRLMNRSTSTWGVWSRRDATVRPVVGGFVDDALDTQRGRGRRSSSRTIFGV